MSAQPNRISWHAISRAWERYGANFNREDILAIEKKIAEEKFGLVTRQNYHSFVVDVEYQGIVFRVAIEWGRIKTFLPRVTNNIRVPRKDMTRKQRRRAKWRLSFS